MNLKLIVVSYNQEVKNSPVIQSYLKSQLLTKDLIVVDNSTDSLYQNINQEYCDNLSISYLNMNGNVGLSKAYNAAIKSTDTLQKDCWYMIFDQDTIVDKEYFDVVIKSIETKNEIKIHAPIIYSKNGLFSPLKIKKNKFLNFDAKSGTYEQLACINSGLVIHSSVYRDFGLYDEDLFLDLVDYNFFKQIYKVNPEFKIQVMDYSLQQNFSGDAFENFTSDLKRFEIYFYDFCKYCKKNNISWIEKNIKLLKRCIRLTIAYKKSDFLWLFLKKREGNEDTVLDQFLLRIKSFCNEKSFYQILIYLFMFDLVLGGAGTYISYGSFSIRKVLFIVLVLMTCYQIVKQKRYKELFYNRTCQLLFLFFISCMLATLIGITKNPIGLVINKLLAYSFIFIFPYFMLNFENSELAIKVFKLFNRLVIILSLAIIIIFFSLFIFQDKAYNIINPILVDLNLGALAINAGIPRVFFKTAIFIPFTLNFELIKVISKEEELNLQVISKILVLGLSLLATMTMGIWATFIVCFLVSLFFIKDKLCEWFKDKKSYFYLITFIIGGVFILYYLDIFTIITNRLNKNDFSVQVKQEQLYTMLELIAKRPLLGYGFGKVIEISIPGYERTAANWEIMWLELLVTNGVIGFIIYLSPIIYNMKIISKLLKDICFKSRSLIISIFTSFIGLIVVNFSNPFLNNPIGIGYLVICFAIINSFLKIKEEL